MGEYAEDLMCYYEEEDFDNSPVMCTNCGEVVKEHQIRFENGISCCVYCAPIIKC